MTGVAGEPRYVPLIIADKTCALAASNAITAALLARERTGRGQFVEIPMFETMAFFILAEHLYGHTFVPPEAPLGYSRLLAPWRRPYRTKDGHICMLAYTDPQWQKFWETVGKPELQQDPRFVNLAKRSQNIAELYRIAGESLLGKTTDEWLEIFQDLDIPCARIASLDEVFNDPHLAAVGLFQKATHPTEGEIVMTQLPLRFSDTKVSIDRMQPKFGEHSARDSARGRDTPTATCARCSSPAARSKALPRRKTRAEQGLEMRTVGIGFYWNDLKVGDRFKTLNRTITESDIVNFIGVTGMLETLFTDLSFGSEHGAIKGRVVPAACVYTMIEGLLCQATMQTTGLALLEIEQKILKPVFAGDTVHAEVEVTAVRPTSKGNRGIVTTQNNVIVAARDTLAITYRAVRMMAGRPEQAD